MPCLALPARHRRNRRAAHASYRFGAVRDRSRRAFTRLAPRAEDVERAHRRAARLGMPREARHRRRRGRAAGPADVREDRAAGGGGDHSRDPRRRGRRRRSRAGARAPRSHGERCGQRCDPPRAGDPEPATTASRSGTERSTDGSHRRRRCQSLRASGGPARRRAASR